MTKEPCWCFFSVLLLCAPAPALEAQPRGTIVFEVKNMKTGFGLAGAVVRAAQDTADKGSLIADCRGRAVFTGPAGEYAFTIRCHNFHPVATHFTIVNGRRMTAGVNLTPVEEAAPAADSAGSRGIAAIEGYVSDSASCRPLAGVSVVCGSLLRRTDTNGHFSFSLAAGAAAAAADALPPSVAIVFKKAGRRTVEMRRYLVAGTCMLKIVMKKGSGRDIIEDTMMHDR